MQADTTTTSNATVQIDTVNVYNSGNKGGTSAEAIAEGVSEAILSGAQDAVQAYQQGQQQGGSTEPSLEVDKLNNEAGKAELSFTDSSGTEYKIEINEQSSKVEITNTETGETTMMRGDPHLYTEGGGNGLEHVGDFLHNMTFVTEGGAKMTIDTTSWGGRSNATLAESITITDGDFGATISGIAGNGETMGDLKVETTADGQALDREKWDGNVTVRENPDGAGWITGDGETLAEDASLLEKTYGPDQKGDDPIHRGGGDYPMPGGLTPSEQGDYQRQLDDIHQMAEDLMTSIIEDNIKREARGSGEVEDEKEGKPGDGGNAASGSTGGESGGSSISMGDLSGFMQLFAKMAEILGEKAGQMAQAVEDLQNAGGEGQEGAQEFAKQQALMQGFTKQFGMMNAAVTNFGKTMGDEGARAVGE